MSGIERLRVVSQSVGHGAWRFDVSQPIHHCQINEIYQSVFNLSDSDCDYLELTREDKLARYDIEFGIDVVLHTIEGHQITVQEKCLTTNYNTVTVEYYQNPQTNEQGDWFKLKCDYYLVAYLVGPIVDRYILLDWNRVKRISSQIPWQLKQNRQDNARANFKYAHFNQFPKECVISERY